MKDTSISFQLEILDQGKWLVGMEENEDGLLVPIIYSDRDLAETDGRFYLEGSFTWRVVQAPTVLLPRE